MNNNQQPKKIMDEIKACSANPAQQQNTLEQLWLNYYNDVLYSKGLITEKERNQMKIMIDSRSRNRKRKKSHEMER